MTEHDDGQGPGWRRVALWLGRLLGEAVAHEVAVRLLEVWPW